MSKWIFPPDISSESKTFIPLICHLHTISFGAGFMLTCNLSPQGFYLVMRAETINDLNLMNGSLYQLRRCSETLYGQSSLFDFRKRRNFNQFLRHKDACAPGSRNARTACFFPSPPTTSKAAVIRSTSACRLHWFGKRRNPATIGALCACAPCKVSGVALHIYMYNNRFFFVWQSHALWPFLKHAKHNRFSRTYDLPLSMLIFSSFDQISSTDTLHGPFSQLTCRPFPPNPGWQKKRREPFKCIGFQWRRSVLHWLFCLSRARISPDGFFDTWRS